jgi:hypothetical protein
VKRLAAIMMFDMGCHQWSRQITLLGLSKEKRESPSVESPGKLCKIGASGKAHQRYVVEEN